MWPWAPPSGPSAGMSSPGALARLEALRSECEWKPLPSSLLRTSFVRSIDGPGLPQRQEQLRAASACVRNASGPDGEAYFIFNRLGAADGSPVAMPPGGWRAWDVRGGFPYIPLLDRRLRAAVVNRTIDVTARESAVDAELANGTARFDRAANLAAGRCDGIRFAEGEAWTSVAFNTAPAAAGRQHSTWVAAVAFDA